MMSLGILVIIALLIYIAILLERMIATLRAASDLNIEKLQGVNEEIWSFRRMIGDRLS